MRTKASAHLTLLRQHEQIIETALLIVECKMNPGDSRVECNQMFYAELAMGERINLLNELELMHKDFIEDFQLRQIPKSLLHATKLLVINIRSNKDPYWQHRFDDGNVGSLLEKIASNLEYFVSLIERINKGHFVAQK